MRWLMNKDQIRQVLSQHIADALAGLKDFQRATVDTVYRQMYQENQRCMLVADEVAVLMERVRSRIRAIDARGLLGPWGAVAAAFGWVRPTGPSS